MEARTALSALCYFQWLYPRFSAVLCALCGIAPQTIRITPKGIDVMNRFDILSERAGLAKIMRWASHEDVGSAHLPAALQEPPHDIYSSSFRGLPRQGKTGAIEYIIGTVSEIFFGPVTHIIPSA